MKNTVSSPSCTDSVEPQMDENTRVKGDCQQQKTLIFQNVVDNCGVAVNEPTASTASPRGLQAEMVGLQDEMVLDSSHSVFMHGFGPMAGANCVHIIGF